MVLVYAIVGIFGLIIGSFLNVFISWLAGERSTLQGRSACPNCGTTLQAWDLVPLVSFLGLRGKCRYCNATLAWQYPAVELLTGVVFMVTALTVLERFAGARAETLVFYLALFLAFTANLVVLFVYDLKYKLVPEPIVGANIMLALIFVFVEGVRADISLNAYLGSALLAALGIWLLYVFTKKQGMGFGDVELVLMLGMVLPVGATWIMFFLSFIIGSLYGLAYVLWKGARSLKVPVPFGPGLIIGFYFVWIGQTFTDFFQSFFVSWARFVELVWSMIT